MILLDGKKTSKELKKEIATAVSMLRQQGKKVPHLAAIIVGNDGASLTYVSSKVKACEQVGFQSTLVRLPEEITQDALLEKVSELNQNLDIDGYIVQLPLPKHIDEEKVLLAINPKKDVDGFHPANFGRMALELESFIPATPYGIMQLLERYDIDTQGKHAVVIGRSHIVGRPISILLSQKGNYANATVTLAHSRTTDLKTLVLQADIVVSALGIPNFVTADMIKPGAVVIDVGITRIPDASTIKGYRIVGDVDFDQVAPKSSYITPVPGGVGPMTIAMLLKNTLLARESNDL
jgi:methylenetetrahydrofolate dehydrogenase (NADP+) / methenyltetrahydrofolate cyclohydrolase